MNAAGTGEFVNIPYYVGTSPGPPRVTAWTQEVYDVTLQRPSSYTWSLSNLIKDAFTVNTSGTFPNLQGSHFVGESGYALKGPSQWIPETYIRSDEKYGTGADISDEYIISTNAPGYISASLSGGSLTMTFENVFDQDYDNTYASVTVGVAASDGSNSDNYEATFTIRVSYST